MFSRLAFLSAFALLAAPVFAQEEPFLTLKLVSEASSIQPGKPFYVGIALHHAPGWHTYWQYPGVVGVPTNIKWQDLPKGFKAEPITWPAPEPVLMFQIKAQGYERDVVLPIMITPPADLKEGTTITLKGKTAYMCCNRQCHPGFEDLELRLPVKTTTPETTEWADKIKRELASHTQTSKAWKASVEESKERFVFTVKPGPGAASISREDASKLIFFTEDGLVDTDKPQQVERRDDGTLVFTLVKTSYIVGDKPKTMIGDLVHSSGWEIGGKVPCLRVEAALP